MSDTNSPLGPRLTQARLTRWLILLAFLWMIRDIVTPVLLGVMGAAALEPVRARLAKHWGRRLTAAALTAAMVTLTVALITVLGARLAAAFGELRSRDWGTMEASVRAYLGNGTLRKLLGEHGEALNARVADLLSSLSQDVARFVGEAAFALPSQLIAGFLFASALFFSLRDGDRMLAWCVAQSPFSTTENQHLRSTLTKTLRGVFLGVIVTSLLQGLLTTGALVIFSVPGAIALGAVAMLLSVLPVVGTTPVTLGAVVYLVSTGHDARALGMAVAAVAIGLSDNIIRPWVQGQETHDQHPLLILVGIFGGLAMFGPTGVFLGPLLAALAAWALEAQQPTPNNKA